MLCQRIGERLAGTQSELRAATYIEKCLSELITNGKQVEQIMAYIKKKRDTKTMMEIKRVYDKKQSSGQANGDDSVSDDANE